jgi:separase
MSAAEDAKLGIDARRAFYILNPSGDLASTQTHFESWMTGMHAAGWKGITGRAVTELEMMAALSNHELVV